MDDSEDHNNKMHFDIINMYIYIIIYIKKYYGVVEYYF